MPTTLNPTCPLCGLRYNDRPLLELHLREDHRPRDRHPDAQPESAGSDDAPADPVPRPPHPGWAQSSLHRVLWALRSADDDLMRAFEALSRERRVSSRGSDRVAGGGRA